jgi:hypothetical protein
MPASLSPRYLVALTAVFVTAVLIFAGVYTATQHKPVPHQVKVGVVGQDTLLKLKIALSLPPLKASYFDMVEYKSPADIATAIKDRKLYAGFYNQGSKAVLVVAPASGKLLRDNLVMTASELLAQLKIPLEVKDLVPLQKGDTSGLSSYTFQYGVLVPSFFFGLLLFMFAYGASLYWRLGLVAGYAVGAGIIGALTVDQIVGALSGHFLALAGLGMLYAATVALVTYGLCATMSWAGAALAGLGLILVGNSVGGGSLNQEFLPDGFRQIGQAFPNGAFIRSVRDTVYFHGHNTGRAIVVVAIWALGGLALVLLAAPVRALVSREKPKEKKAAPPRRAKKAAPGKAS